MAAYGGYRYGITPVNDGQWHHVAVVLDNDGTPNTNDVQIFIDGIVESSYSTSAVAINTQPAQNVQIGIFNYIDTTDRYFIGQIDDVRIYDRALSYIEVAALAEPGL